jgi:hypothetical protein
MDALLLGPSTSSSALRIETARTPQKKKESWPQKTQKRTDDLAFVLGFVGSWQACAVAKSDDANLAGCINLLQTDYIRR